MTRIGWLLLLAFVAAAVAFGLMLGPEGAAPGPEPRPTVTADRTVSGDLVLPVAGVRREELTDSWGEPRGGGSRRHKAIDIMAARGTPVIAAAPGTVEKLFDSRDGGRTVYVRSANGGTIYYYAHLDRYRPGLAEGQPVRAGDVIGTVGSTGSASEEAPHLHFEIKRMRPGERWHQGEEINPYPLLAGRTAAR